MILEEINKATTSIHMQAYSFTSKPIADALIRAHKRAVIVVVIADKSQRKEKYTQINNQLIASFFMIFSNFIKIIIFQDDKIYNRMIFS